MNDINRKATNIVSIIDVDGHVIEEIKLKEKIMPIPNMMLILDKQIGSENYIHY